MRLNILLNVYYDAELGCGYCMLFQERTGACQAFGMLGSSKLNDNPRHYRRHPKCFEAERAVKPDSEGK